MKSSTQLLVEPQTDPPEETPMVNGLVASQFILLLRDTFLSTEAHDELWNSDFVDPDAINRKALIAADIAAAFRSVFMRNEEGEDSAPEPGSEGSAAKRMKDLLTGDAAQWPKDEAFPLPAGYTHDPFRRYEVGCAVAILMEAFHRSGSGGGIPTEFPPTKPH